MPYRVPSGDPNTYFIARVRRNLRDQPVWFQEPFTTDGVKGAIGVAGSVPYRLKRAPVVTTGLQCSLAVAVQAVTFDGAPGAGVAVVSDTGEFYFANPPAAAQSILMTYQAARYSDQQILDALKDGMFEMWPEIWLPQVDTSIIFTPSFTEYTLPLIFSDPRVFILSLEVQPPSGILISVPTGRYDTPGNSTILKLSRGWPAGSIIRIFYNAPYVNLADLEEQIEQLPIYYATYKILMDQETMRTRSNDLVQQTGEGAAAPEQASATAQLWLDRFKDAKRNLGVMSAVRSNVPDRSVEMLESGMGFSWNPL